MSLRTVCQDDCLSFNGAAASFFSVVVFVEFRQFAAEQCPASKGARKLSFGGKKSSRVNRVRPKREAPKIYT